MPIGQIIVIVVLVGIPCTIYCYATLKDRKKKKVKKLHTQKVSDFSFLEHRDDEAHIFTNTGF